MTLTPMRYKGYTWPYNPRIYSIDFKRVMAVNHTPFSGYQLQDLGRSHRVMKGEGEFVGEGAYAEFQKLACVFYGGGPGTLVHPLWQTSSAYLVALRLEQAPRPDYVRYSFEFWEENSLYNGMVTRAAEAKPAAGQTAAQPTGNFAVPPDAASLFAGSPDYSPLMTVHSVGTVQPVYHKAAEGDTLWSLAAQYGQNTMELIALNPQVKNPNLLYVGQEVRVR